VVTTAKNSAQASAITRSNSNNYANVDSDPTDGNGVSAVCGQDDNGSYIDKYVDITTSINTGTRTSFAHLIFGDLANDVDATARIRPQMPLAFGYAIVGLNPSGCTGNVGVQAGGSSDTTVVGGGIWSNGCLDTDGNNDANLWDGNIRYVKEVRDNNWHIHNGDLAKAPNVLPREVWYIAPPDCSTLPARTTNGNGTIQPGVYSQIKLTGHDSLVMEPGLYCITSSGDAFSVQGGDVTGTGVTIYATNGGDIKINGGTVSLQAGADGLLIYTDSASNKAVQLNGNAGNFFKGTVYAPKGNVAINGGSANVAIQTQVIGWDVDLRGNADTFIQYNAPDNWLLLPSLELLE
jgi:hypothetical protein